MMISCQLAINELLWINILLHPTSWPLLLACRLLGSPLQRITYHPAAHRTICSAVSTPLSAHCTAVSFPGAKPAGSVITGSGWQVTPSATQECLPYLIALITVVLFVSRTRASLTRSRSHPVWAPASSLGT
jgi:hypothetical protein